MHLELTQFLSTDNLVLPGLLYTPDVPTSRVFVWLHGMGDGGIFYSQERITALAKKLTQQGIAFFPFNNRGAHNSKTLRQVSDDPETDDGSYQAGTYYEKIVDCVADIDGAVTFLKRRGMHEFILGGHSTGANKICVYHALADDHNPFTRYVLAGPGDDSGIHFRELGASTFQKALAYAKRAIERGTPLTTMPLYTGMHPFSAQSALDILDPNGAYNTFPLYEATTARIGTKQLFAEYRTIQLPMLVLYGEHDEYTDATGGTAAALDTFRSFTHPSVQESSQFALIPDTDHGFHGQELAFARCIAKWVAA
ncbi:MAG TPA: DUF1749 domain-containing protein [Candidatus Saccharimonadales bacterium]|nr:DUF1749 domain-containing protein [Candidatus Saccharimonadales bacterium]